MVTNTRSIEPHKEVCSRLTITYSSGLEKSYDFQDKKSDVIKTINMLNSGSTDGTATLWVGSGYIYINKSLVASVGVEIYKVVGQDDWTPHSGRS